MEKRVCSPTLHPNLNTLFLACIIREDVINEEQWVAVLGGGYRTMGIQHDWDKST